MLLMMYMMISLPPCSQVCSGTWWCLSCWNSPAIPLWYSPSFISCGFLLLSLSLSFCPLMVVVRSHSSELSESLIVDSQAGKGSQLSERNVEEHPSVETQHISVQEAHCLWQKSSLFCFFPSIWPSCEFVSWASTICRERGSCQFSQIRSPLSVLPDRGTKFWMSSTDFSESNSLSWAWDDSVTVGHSLFCH